MSKIEIEHEPDDDRLRKLGVYDWPIWTKEISKFPWTYEVSETCYILEGDVVVTPEDGQSVTVGKGDLVTFPRGMVCTWEVRRPVRKHYRLG